MKRILLTLALGLLFINFYGQEGEFYSFSLQNPSPLRHTVFIKPLVNKTKATDIDVNKIINDELNIVYGGYSNGSKKTANLNVWSKQDFFKPAPTAAEAMVVISGSYKFVGETKNAEKKMTETGSAFAFQIPYTESHTINSVELTVVMKFEYKNDPAVIDTFYFTKQSELGKDGVFLSIEQLKDKCTKAFEQKLDDYTYFFGQKDYWYRFTKIKIKDKALKEEFKTASDLLKGGQVKELGALYKKIYEKEPSAEVAHCIGMCYELLGNYPKAMEFYKQLVDFPTKTRMKKHMELYEYLQAFGFELTLEEF